VARDLLDRVVAEFPIADMMARLKEPATNPVSNDKVSQESNANLEKIYSTLTDIANKIDPNAKGDMEKSKSWATSIIDYIKQTKTPVNQKESGTVKDPQTAYMAIMAEATSKLWEASQSQNTLWVGLAHLTSRAQKDIANAIDMSNCCGATSKTMSEAADKITAATQDGSQKMQQAMKEAGKQPVGSKDITQSQSTSTSSGLQDLSESASSIGKQGMKWAFTMMAINKAVQMFDRTVAELDIKLSKIVPSIKDVNNFRESIRSIIHQQYGFGNANREVEQSFKNIYHSVLASGVSTAKFSELYLKNLERGFDIESEQDKFATRGLRADKQQEVLLKRRAARMQSIQTSALNTATMLGMSADGMNELFMDWHYQIGLSSIELADMGRHMQQIAKSSGLTGVQLEAAMKSSNAVIQNLQKQGSASLNNMKKVTEFMASAQKFGMQSGTDFMNALGDSQAFMESKMSTYLTQAAAQARDPRRAIQNLQMGTTFEDPEGMKNLLSGMQKQAQQIFGSVGVNIDLDKDPMAMSKAIQKMKESGDARQMAAAVQLQRIYESMGMPIGEAEKAMLSMKDASRSLGEKTKEASDKLKALADANLKGTDAYKQQERVVNEMQNSLYANAFGKLNKYSNELKAAGGVGGLDAKSRAALEKQLLQDFGDTEDGRKKMKDFLGNLQQNSTDLMSRLKTSATNVGVSEKNFEAKFVERGMTSKEVAAGIQSGDEKALQILNQVMQDISSQEKAAQDPVTEIRDILRRLEAQFSDKANKLSFWMPDLGYKIAYWSGTVASVVLQLAGLFYGFKGLKGLTNLFKGGGAAGGGGGGGGGGAATTTPKQGMWSKIKGWFGKGGAPASTPTPPVTPPPVQTGSAAPKAGGLGRFIPKSRGGKAFAITAAVAAIGTYAYSKFGGKGEADAAAAGDLPEGGDVLSVLKQIEINTRCLCAGAGEGAAGGPSVGGAAGGSPIENAAAGAGGTDFGAPETSAEYELAKSVLPAAGMAVAGMGPSVGQMVGLPQPSAAGAGVTTAASSTVANAASSIPPATGGGGGFFSNLWGKAKNAYGTVKGAVGSAYGTAKGAVGSAYGTVKGAVGSAYGTVKGAVGQAGSYIADKTGIKKVTELITGNMGKVFPEFLKKGGGLIKGGLGNILNKIPVIGAIIQAISTGMDVNEIAKQQGIPKEEMYSMIGKEVIAGGLSFIAGTLAGAGLGTLLSIPPLTGWGSFIGSVIGYMGGAWLGDLLGRSISDYVGGPALGKMIFDMFYEDKPAGATTGSAETTEVSPPAFEVGTREIKQGGFAELHKGEMVIPSTVWDKIVAVGSGAFGGGADVVSKFDKTFDVLKNAMNPYATVAKSIGGKINEMSGGRLAKLGESIASMTSPLGAAFNLMPKKKKEETTTITQIDSLLEALKQLIEAIKSKKCCEVGMSLEGAFEGDQAKEAIDSEMSRSLKMQTLKVDEEAKAGKVQGGKVGALGALLKMAFESQSNSVKEVLKSVANFGLFDKEKTSEAHDYYSEGVQKAMDLSSKFDPSNMSFKKVDYKEGMTKMSLSEVLLKTIESIKTMGKVAFTPVGLGLFDNKQSNEAQNLHLDELTSKTQVKSLNEMIQDAKFSKQKKDVGDALGLSMGLFDPEKATEANDDFVKQQISKAFGTSNGELNEVVKTFIATKQDSEKREKNIIAEVSRALDYDTSASDAANQTLVTTNALDYSDDMRGEVGSLGLSRVAAESAVAQAKYGESGSGNTAILPSMDSIADYLIVEQARKLDQMILVMEQIRDKLSTGGVAGSEIIRASTDMLSPPTRPGVKNIAKDFTKGAWDLTFSDYSSGVVTTDGRGGN
jgi:hypothetical protein